MARPVKKGLDFFPLDVVIEDNLELLEAECGLEGFAIIIKLWQKIYATGYFIDWEEDNALLFARKINSDLTTVNKVVNVGLNRGLFNKNLFNSYKILSSKGIQIRYTKICSDANRKDYSILDEHNLINSELTRVNTEETEVKSESSTQSKVNKNKEDNKEYSVFFEDCWKLYPNKKGKGQISDTKKKEVFKLGEEFKRCISRYIKYVKTEDWIKYQNGSTFFNSGYIDYLDDNYQETKPVKEPELLGRKGIRVIGL